MRVEERESNLSVMLSDNVEGTLIPKPARSDVMLVLSLLDISRPLGTMFYAFTISADVV